MCILARVDCACDKVSRACMRVRQSDTPWSLLGRISRRLLHARACLVIRRQRLPRRRTRRRAYDTAHIWKKIAVASHTRHGNTFAYSRPAALGHGQDSVSKATIPACMTLGDMHMAWGRILCCLSVFLLPVTCTALHIRVPIDEFSAAACLPCCSRHPIECTCSPARPSQSPPAVRVLSARPLRTRPRPAPYK